GDRLRDPHQKLADVRRADGLYLRAVDRRDGGRRREGVSGESRAGDDELLELGRLGLPASRLLGAYPPRYECGETRQCVSPRPCPKRTPNGAADGFVCHVASPSRVAAGPRALDSMSRERTLRHSARRARIRALTGATKSVPCVVAR